MLNNQETISLAEISQYLWCDAIPKENQFFNGTIDPRKAQQLYMVRTAYQYGVAQGLSNLEGLANYVYALCGAKLQIAKQILGTGTSGSAVVPGNSGNAMVMEYSTNASLGSTTVYFPEAAGKRLINAFRQGNNIGQIIFSGTPTGNQVVWNIDSGALTVSSSIPFGDLEFVRVICQQ